MWLEQAWAWAWAWAGMLAERPQAFSSQLRLAGVGGLASQIPGVRAAACWRAGRQPEVHLAEQAEVSTSTASNTSALSTSGTLPLAPARLIKDHRTRCRLGPPSDSDRVGWAACRLKTC